MIDQITRDTLALVIVALGIATAILCFMSWRICQKDHRWVYLVSSFAALAPAVIFLLALFRLYGGTDILERWPTTLSFSLLLLSLLFTSRITHNKGDHC
jgi:hypothetical protein